MALELPAQLLREGLTLLSVASLPLLGGLLVIGILVGLLQAMTQLHDPSVSFLPRLLTVVAVILATGDLVVTRFAAFFASAVQRMAGGGG
jgi:flagellar biosynthesis protein FliQ